MNKNQYEPPVFQKDSFNCPFCGAFSHQKWLKVYVKPTTGVFRNEDNMQAASCGRCDRSSIWIKEKMIYPKILTAPLAYIDMPKPVKELYEEARLISNDSPRAAAALLRVALEKLTEELGEKTGALNTRIGNLHKEGLPKTVISSLDIVRINANEGGSHSGEIDLTGNDGAEIVDKLFWLVNIIIEKTISEPKEIEKQFSSLPQHKKDGIENRDNNGTD